MTCHKHTILSLTLSSFTPNPPRKLHILRHNCNSLSMNRTQIRILKQPNKVRLSRLLKRRNSRTLKP
ncbi:hypothetical protein Hanom_Chr07g00658951 [Helianthus anomalus]